MNHMPMVPAAHNLMGQGRVCLLGTGAHWNPGWMGIKILVVTLASLAQWIEHHPAD